MSMRVFVPIVEGYGEVEAVPKLIHRIFAEAGAEVFPRVNPPIRVKVGSFLRDDGYFGKHIEMAASKAAQSGGVVLILLDCEDDCPATLGPEILAKARKLRPDVSFLVSLAHREYETIFLAAAESLRGQGLKIDASAPPAPEAIRGAKEWLGRHMDSPYDPIIHQAAFTSRIDLVPARSIPSFARLEAKLLS